MQPHLYNLTTLIWHKKLHRPVTFHRTFDYAPKNYTHTIVFLHGIAATSKSWLPTVTSLASDPELQNFRFVVFDILGFGKTLKADWLNYDYQNYRGALNHSLKKYQIKTPVILVGHSMGALIAANFATKYPKKVQDLILVSPPVLLAKDVAKVPDKFYAKSFTSLAKNADNHAIQTIANFIDRLSSFNARYLNTTAFSASMKNIVLNPENYHTLTHLKTPTTIIHGRFDPLVYGPNLSRALKANPDLKLITVSSQHDLSPLKRDRIKEVLIGIKDA